MSKGRYSSTQNKNKAPSGVGIVTASIWRAWIIPLRDRATLVLLNEAKWRVMGRTHDLYQE